MERSFDAVEFIILVSTAFHVMMNEFAFCFGFKPAADFAFKCFQSFSTIDQLESFSRAFVLAIRRAFEHFYACRMSHPLMHEQIFSSSKAHVAKFASKLVCSVLTCPLVSIELPFPVGLEGA